MFRILAVCLIVLSMAVAVQAMCVQDQYGGQYEFTIDASHTYLFGEYRPGSGCDASAWYLTGSYVIAGGTKYELTAANPLGDSDSGCIATFKIKGTYPNGAWYYSGGYGGQEFELGACTATNANSSQAGGALR